MMNRILLFLISLVLLPSLLIGCKKDVLPSEANSAILLSTEIVGQNKTGATTIKTNTRTTIEGDLGAFVTQYANADARVLLSSGNVYDNVKITDGVASASMYYPSRRDAVDVYAYLPYSEGLNPTQVAISVPETQTASSILAADFLRGVKKQTAPTSQPGKVSVQLEHVLSLVMIEVALPVEFTNKDITEITSAQLLSLNTTAKYHIGTDVWSGLGASKNIKMCQIGDAVINEDEGLTYKFEAIVVPQTLASKKFFEIEVKFTDKTTQKFECELSAVAKFDTKTAHKYNITLSNYGKLEVKSTQIADWTDENLFGLLGSDVNNVLKFVLLEQSYWANLKKVVLSIGGKNYTCTLKADASNNKLVAYYEGKLPDDSGAVPASYPYSIDKLTFTNSSDEEFEIKGNNLNISSSGLMNIALIKNATLLASSEQIAAWVTDIKEPVVPYDNTLRFTLLDQPYWQGLNSVELLIDGQVFVCSGAKFAATAGKTSNKLLAYYDALLPDDNGKMPLSYPSIISKISFKKSNTVVKNVYCDIVLSRSGILDIAVLNDIALGLTGNNEFASWTDLARWDVLPSAYVMNVLNLSLWDLSYSNDITKIEILTNKGNVSCSGAKLVVGVDKNIYGNKYKYSVLLPGDANAVPTSYPFEITGFNFYNGATKNSLTLSSPVSITSNNNTSEVNIGVYLNKVAVKR